MATKYYEDVINKAGLETVKAEDLQKKFDAVTEIEYDKQRAELQNTENKFYNKLYDTQKTTMDTIRQNNASAVATGASKGIQAANELSALLGLQQESVEGATDIANQATTLAQDETQAMLENVLTAEQQAQEANQALANILVQAGSVDVEGQNADTAAEQVQQQWQQLIEQIRQTNPTQANILQKEYDAYYAGIGGGATGTPTTAEGTAANTGAASGSTTTNTTAVPKTTADYYTELSNKGYSTGQQRIIDMSKPVAEWGDYLEQIDFDANTAKGKAGAYISAVQKAALNNEIPVGAFVQLNYGAMDGDGNYSYVYMGDGVFAKAIYTIKDDSKAIWAPEGYKIERDYSGAKDKLKVKKK